MITVAKLFMSGRSQAIRLPAKLRLQAQQVRIEKIGEALWIKPEVDTPTPTDMAQWLQAFYQSTDALPPDFMADRDDAVPQARDWS